jgi:sugar-specific transcriptional regulator TrmB
MKDELEKLGFAGHQAEIYLALVDLKQCGAGDLVKKTGIHRNIVYETLDRLIAKRLVVKVMKKSVYQYRITDPDMILEQQRSNLTLAESIIPDIKKRVESQNDIMVWDGVEGFRNFRLSLLESIKPGGIIHILGAIGGEKWSELMGPYYKRSEKIRLAKKIVYKMIIYKKDDFDAAMIKSRKYYDVRIIENNFSTPANMMVLGDRIAMHIYEEPISVIEITSKPLAKAYMNYFNIMWGIAKDIV